MITLSPTFAKPASHHRQQDLQVRRQVRTGGPADDADRDVLVEIGKVSNDGTGRRRIKRSPWQDRHSQATLYRSL
jgi:hypothetical protein